MMRKFLSVAMAAVLLLGAVGGAMATDCSGTITAGGTAQTVFTSSNVRGFLIANNSANLMCVSFAGVAATIAGTNCGAGSWTLQPGSATAAGGSFSNPVNIVISAVSIISSTTGDRFSCERQ